MKKIILFELPVSFCRTYHAVIVGLHVLGGIVGVYMTQPPDMSVALSIFMTIAVVVIGTLCFGIFPVFCICLSMVTRFVPVIGLPAYLVMSIGVAFGDSTDIGIDMFLLCLGLTLWGWFNIRTATIANRDEDFNGIMIING